MNNLKLKVKFLEQKLIADKIQLNQQFNHLRQRLFATPYFEAKLILGGFIVGFLLAPVKNNLLQQAFTKLLMVFNTMKLTSQYLTFI